MDTHAAPPPKKIALRPDFQIPGECGVPAAALAAVWLERAAQVFGRQRLAFGDVLSAKP